MLVENPPFDLYLDIAKIYLDLARQMAMEDAELLERSTWRLIDTAPRDGTPIIAWDVDPTTNPTGRWVIVSWQSMPALQNANAGAWMIAEGLYTNAPSHWMPVPPQPPPPED